MEYDAAMRRTGGAAVALFTCVAACGDVTSFIDAAPGDDDPIDAQVEPDARPTGQVTVTTRSRCCDQPAGTLVAGVQVVVVQPDGSAGDSGQTDSSGTITLDDVQAGAAVTAIYTTSDGYDIVTVVGVEPGDALQMGESYRPQYFGNTTGNGTITFPTYPGTYYYQAQYQCTSTSVYDGAATSMTMYYYQDCQPTVGDVVLSAYSPSYQMIASTIIRNASTVPGSTIAVSGWSSALSFTASATGLPEHVSEVRFYVQPVLGEFYPGGQNYYTSPEGGTATGTMGLPGGTDRISVMSELRRPGDLGRQRTWRGVSGSTTSTAFATNELPWVGPSYFSASAQRASWTQLGDEPYDGAIAHVGWYINSGSPDLFGAPGNYRNWTIMLPPGVTEWTWDQVPAALEPYVPQVGDAPYRELFLIDLADADGYAELRGVDERIYSCPECAVRDGAYTSDVTTAYSYDGGEGFAARPAQLRAPWQLEEPAAPALPARPAQN